MNHNFYYYVECGLKNIFLKNGYNIIETERGNAVSVKDIDGLHGAIGTFLIYSKKDLAREELRFLRHEMLMPQNTVTHLLGVSKQIIQRWEKVLFEHTPQGWKASESP